MSKQWGVAFENGYVAEQETRDEAFRISGIYDGTWVVYREVSSWSD